MRPLFGASRTYKDFLKLSYEVGRKLYSMGGEHRKLIEAHWKEVDELAFQQYYYNHYCKKYSFPKYHPFEIFPEAKPKRLLGSAKVSPEDVKTAENVPIEQVIKSFGIQVKRSMACCPFHGEQRPSMSLARHNRFKCFSCGISGNTIQFVMKMGNLRFPEAVNQLLRR
jgi:hypothetical protein